MKTKINYIKGDITTSNADCIVNAANEHLIAGAGVCGAIFNKVKDPIGLATECNQYQGCAIGNAIATGGYGLSEYIIHAVGPIYHNHLPEKAKELLVSAYKESLLLAEDLKVSSIAFPLLSTGIYGYPKEEAVELALLTIGEHCLGKTSLKEITFYCFTDEDYDLVKAFMEEMLVEE